jgi:uncharacterized membrane protein YfcA
MLRAFPISIFTAFSRPFIWDGGSLFIRLSAIEAFLFLILTIRFIFFRNILQKLKAIRNNELLMASMIFALILGFFAGYTSGLFGVLVRFKAPLLPFLFLVLMYKKENERFMDMLGWNGSPTNPYFEMYQYLINLFND